MYTENKMNLCKHLCKQKSLVVVMWLLALALILAVKSSTVAARREVPACTGAPCVAISTSVHTPIMTPDPIDPAHPKSFHLVIEWHLIAPMATAQTLFFSVMTAQALREGTDPTLVERPRISVSTDERQLGVHSGNRIAMRGEGRPEALRLFKAGQTVIRQPVQIRVAGVSNRGTYPLLFLVTDERNQLHGSLLVTVINGKAYPDRGSNHLEQVLRRRNVAAPNAVEGYEIDFSTTPPQLVKLDLADNRSRTASKFVAHVKAQMSPGDHHLLFFAPGSGGIAGDVCALRIMK
jgi:hypothetical protein